MTTGTKSLLFGVHQVLWHPITVLIAWVVLYRAPPSWKELLCIVIHDWGYWGKPNMDGPEGESHPEWAARFAEKHLGKEYRDLCLYHSRHYARRDGSTPSRLCWADKLSICYDPRWFYLLRAKLSGELFEYLDLAENAGLVPEGCSHENWLEVMRDKFRRLAIEKDTAAVPYVNQNGTAPPRGGEPPEDPEEPHDYRWHRMQSADDLRQTAQGLQELADLVEKGDVNALQDFLFGSDGEPAGVRGLIELLRVRFAFRQEEVQEWRKKHMTGVPGNTDPAQDQERP